MTKLPKDTNRLLDNHATLSRRQFLKSAALAAGAGLTLLPGGMLRGANAPSHQLTVALIGVGGRGRAHFGAVKGEKVVALCDVNERAITEAAKVFPTAKRYVDWRRCLDHPGLDAVVCSTTDHTHAFIANWSINRGLHIFLEKPLANSVEEARVVRANYLKHKHKLATQVGMQRHAIPNFDRVREAILDGAVGTLEHVHVWGNRTHSRTAYLPAEGDPPPELHWDLWLGPSPWHPFNPGYIGGCLKWNMHWDFGSWQVGDMGSHTMDLAWNAIDAALPTSAEGQGDPFNPDVVPSALTMTFEHPANPWRPPIKVTWYQGSHKPNSLGGVPTQPGHGALFVGDRASLLADFNQHEFVPRTEAAGMAHYRPRPAAERIAPMGGFQEQWVQACKGDLKTACDFDYSGTMIEQLLLGLVAYRVGKKIQYDGAVGRVTNSPEANALLKREYRPGWTLNG
ncbi:MAG: Gfo/Idh/MocA family oxidoreductase [Verrucomicrobia bacterium]|nr:Gfo/Idh/MocA family oxidoreductase [Verrucomicrobiota bacterium]